MITSLLYRFTYIGMLALLLAAGLGVPIPEDIVLLTGGYLAHEGITSIVPTLLFGYGGVILGDLLIFRLGRKLRGRIYTHRWFGKLLTADRREKIERHFHKYGILTVVIGRHTAGLRAPTFLVAGCSGMATWKFFIADALSSLSTVPLVVMLGYFLAHNLERAKKHMHRIQL